MAEHRVPMLSPALHRLPDPERSPDPRVRALVGQLRTLELPGPRPEFRSELRTQLVAITPRIVAEGDLPVGTKRRPSPVPLAEPSKQPRKVRTGRSRLAHVKIGRPLAVITCVIAVFAVLLGGAVWISKRALPGDALYGLKRASENLQEAMTSGDTARAKLFLDFADTRYGEVSDLLPSKSAPVDSSTSSLVDSTLNSADSDIKSGMQALGSQAIRDRSGSGLALVTAWAPGELSKLRSIVARMPAGAVHQRGDLSLALLTQAQHRAAQLKALGNCGCLATARTDDLGAVPCTKCASAAPALAPATRTHANTPRRTSHSGTATTGAGASTHGGAAATHPGAGTSKAPGPSGGASTSSGAGVPGLPGVPGIPTVSNPLGSGSGSDCTGLDLGLLSVGRCGVGLGGN